MANKDKWIMWSVVALAALAVTGYLTTVKATLNSLPAVAGIGLGTVIVVGLAYLGFMKKTDPILKNKYDVKKTLAVVGIVAMFVPLSMSMFQTGTFSGTDKDADPEGGTNCPDTQLAAFQADWLNDLATSSKYVAGTVRAVPAGDSTNFVGYTTAASSTRATAVNLHCVQPAKTYTVYPLATIEVLNSAPAMSVTPNSPTASVTVVGTNFSQIKAKAKDNLADAWIYDTGDADNTDYEVVGVTFDSSTDNVTAYAMTDSTTFDWTFQVVANNSDGQFGDGRLGCYIAVDADSTDYKTPTAYWEGIAMSDVADITTEISGNDRSDLSGYEYIFKIPNNDQFGETIKNFRLVVMPDGVNPDVDIVWKAVCKGYYVKADGVTVDLAIFNADSDSEILTATEQKYICNIS
jgi:hypothetical protein